MQNGEHLKRIPRRPDGSRKAYWFEDGHVFHLRADGSIHCFGFYCDHEVAQICPE